MTRQKVIDAVLSTVAEMRPSIYVPNPATRGKTSKGEMAFNALQVRIEGDIIDVYINEDVAPYCVYTNDPWLSPKWHGKKNPNEGWWKRFCEEFMRRVAKKLRGKVK